MSGRGETQIASSDIKRRKLQMDSKKSNEDQLLQERKCLWDLFCKAHSKWDEKSKAYLDIAELLEKPVESVKVKINGLRTQLGREISK